MKTYIKKCICVVLSALMIIAAPMKADAYVVTTHFADSFDYYNSQEWEKADGWTNGGMFNCEWKASNVNFGNGNLYLSITDNPGGIKPYAGGEYRTRNEFGYGLYQVRMKPAKCTGTVSSFFTYNGSPWDEIDIEFLGKDTTKVQFNFYVNGQGNHEYLYDLGFDASESFHTYAIDWQKNYIAWRVDGVEKHRVTSQQYTIPSHPGKIMLNIWPGIGVDEWLGYFNGVPAGGITATYDWMSYDPIIVE